MDRDGPEPSATMQQNGAAHSLDKDSVVQLQENFLSLTVNSFLGK